LLDKIVGNVFFFFFKTKIIFFFFFFFFFFINIYSFIQLIIYFIKNEKHFTLLYFILIKALCVIFVTVDNLNTNNLIIIYIQDYLISYLFLYYYTMKIKVRFKYI